MQRYSYLAIILSFCLSLPAFSQVAGNRLGACPEKLVFSEVQQEMIAYFSVLGKDVERRHFATRNSPNLVAPAMSCTKHVAYAVCTDRLLDSFIGFDGGDVVAMGAGAIALGSNGKPSLFGATLGKMAKSTFDVAKSGICQQTLEERIQPAAKKVFVNQTLDLDARDAEYVRQYIRNAASGGVISYEDAQQLMEFGRGVHAFMQAN